ncbi:MAG: hypothetical protein AB7O98_14620 [Hyphomonadaceae bacterium]
MSARVDVSVLFPSRAVFFRSLHHANSNLFWFALLPLAAVAITKLPDLGLWTVVLGMLIVYAIVFFVFYTFCCSIAWIALRNDVIVREEYLARSDEQKAQMLAAPSSWHAKRKL